MMTKEAAEPVILVSRWTILPGHQEAALRALEQLAEAVRAGEPGTLLYQVHTPTQSTTLDSLPATNARDVIFYEIYADEAAFRAHVDGPLFTCFVRVHGHLFLQAPLPPGVQGPQPFRTVEFLSRRFGFSRAPGPVGTPRHGNMHPAVMFEIIARDEARLRAFYQAVFGWEYTVGTGGFAYVQFPSWPTPLLGGVGQADPSVKGFEPGRSFYLLVDRLEPTLERIRQRGGTEYMPPTSIDGYRFAMFHDPEGNLIGLIEPFGQHGLSGGAAPG